MLAVAGVYCRRPPSPFHHRRRSKAECFCSEDAAILAAVACCDVQQGVSTEFHAAACVLLDCCLLACVMRCAVLLAVVLSSFDVCFAWSIGLIVT